MFRQRKEKRLGTATQKRQYDLPLRRGEGTRFLVVLIGLMTFLAVIALSASYALGGIAERWTSGLENHITVEIPATKPDGTLLSPQEVKSLTADMVTLITNQPGVVSAEPMSEEDIQQLVDPWLGDTGLLEDMPLPGLITVTVNRDNKRILDVLDQRIKNVADNASLDTHESWLNDVLGFTNSMRFAALLLVLIITLIAIIAVAGAIRARISIHKEEVELLHLMGASDTYISKQFQRYAFILALTGAIGGTVLGGISLLIIKWLSGEMNGLLLPDFSLSGLQIISLIAIPVIAALIALITSRQTVLNVLIKMP